MNMVFTAEHAAALNTVDLTIHGMNHGAMTSLGRAGDYHEYCRGVNDESYQYVEDLVASMNPERGDSLAVECRGYSLSANEELQSDAQIIHADAWRRQAVVQRLERGSYLRTHSPFTHAVGRAALRGIRIEHADINKEQLEDLREVVQDLKREVPFWLAGAIYAATDQSRNTLREWHMLARLAEMAQTIPTDQRACAEAAGQKPRVDYLVGGAHLAGLSYELRSSEVNFTANKSLLAERWGDVTHTFDFFIFEPLQTMLRIAPHQRIIRRRKNPSWPKDK